jgi:4-hydroxybenzoate polyprenyltransferase
VWTNVLAGMILAGASDSELWRGWVVGLVGSMFYIGGMFLNDAFDAEVDAEERPERPIPSGLIDREVVFRWGFGWLLAGFVVLLGFAARTSLGWGAPAAALLTIAFIVIYDRVHKQTAAAPFIMGMCRVGVYMMAALSVAPLPNTRVVLGGIVLLAYVLGLTYAAQFESGGTPKRWPSLLLFAPLGYALPAIGGPLWARALLAAFLLWTTRAEERIRSGDPAGTREGVGSLIAGICLVDALVIAQFGSFSDAAIAVLCFGATLVFQRRIAGT